MEPEEKKIEPEEKKIEPEEKNEPELDENKPNADETPLQTSADGGISNKELMDLLIQLQQQVIAIQDVQDTEKPIEANAEQTEGEQGPDTLNGTTEPTAESKYDDEEELAKVDALLNEK